MCPELLPPAAPAYSLSRLRERVGVREQARSALTPALSRKRERGTACWLGFALALLGCHEAKPAEPDAGPLRVEVARVQRVQVADAVELAGLLAPLPGRDVKLGSLVAGRLAEVRVAEGDAVQRGQLLARLDPAPLQDAVRQAEAALAQAQAQVANAEGKLERARRALQAGAAARQEVDDAEAQATTARSARSSAEAALATARGQLGRTELRAPFDGAVAHVFASAGEPVDGSGKPLVEVADTRSLELRAAAPPGALGGVRPGQAAEVWQGEGPHRPGRVLAVAPLADEATGLVAVRIAVDNPEGALKGGAPGRARIATSEAHPALAVPTEALVPLDPAAGSDAERGKLAVVLVGADGKAHRVAVEPGPPAGPGRAVRGELHEGERVVLRGAYGLPDGQPVLPSEPAPGPVGDGGQP